MKTAFCNLMMSLAVLAGIAVATPAMAERTVGWSLLGGDTFILNDNLMVGHGDYLSQLRMDGEELVTTVPEQRDNDGVMSASELADFQFDGNDQWMGSTNLVFGTDAAVVSPPSLANRVDGYVEVKNTATRGMAFLPIVEHPTLGATFKVEGDVRVPTAGTNPGANVASIGMIRQLTSQENNDLSLLTNGATGFGTGGLGANGVAALWVRVAEFNQQTEFVLDGEGNPVLDNNDNPIPFVDSLGNTFLNQNVAQICLMSGNTMVERVFIPLAANGVQDLVLSAANNVPDFDYGTYSLSNLTNGFDRIWLEWFPDTNEVEVKINNNLVDALSIDMDNVDLNGDNIIDGLTVNVNAMAFQLQGSGQLSRFAATPEPSSMLMMCFGMLFFGMQNRRQRRRAQKLGLTSSIAG